MNNLGIDSPPELRKALTLLWVGLALRLIASLAWLKWQSIPLDLGTLLTSAWSMLGFVATVMLLFAVRDRRNWARYLLVLLTGYGLVLSILNGLVSWGRLWPLVVTDVFSGVLAICALAMLFRPTSSAWFRARNTASKPSAAV